MTIEERPQRSAFRTGGNDFEPMEDRNAQTWCMSSYYNYNCFALEAEFMIPYFLLVTSFHRSSVSFLLIAVALVVVYPRHHKKAETIIFRSWVYLSCGRGLPSFFSWPT
jgi:hypothetical protein